MKKKEELLRLMEEAVILPPEDPQRQAVETAIAGEEAWAKEEWLDLLREDELLRLELRRVSSPAGLEQRLLSIPEEVRRPGLFVPRWFGVAAAILVFAMGAGLLRHFHKAAGFSEQINNIALFAASDHVNNHLLAMKMGDKTAIVTHLSKQVPFKVKIPNLPSGFQLIGGRKCSLGTRTVVYTRWKWRQIGYSLFQLCPKDFDLPDAFPRQIVSTKGPAMAGEPCEILIWAENGCAYAIVTGSRSSMDQIIPDSTRKKEVMFTL